jgi:hypothetical protein
MTLTIEASRRGEGGGGMAVRLNDGDATRATGKQLAVGGAGGRSQTRGGRRRKEPERLEGSAGEERWEVEDNKDRELPLGDPCQYYRPIVMKQQIINEDGDAGSQYLVPQKYASPLLGLN